MYGRYAVIWYAFHYEVIDKLDNNRRVYASRSQERAHWRAVQLRDKWEAARLATTSQPAPTAPQLGSQ